MQFGTAPLSSNTAPPPEHKPLWGCLPEGGGQRALDTALVIMVSEMNVDGAYSDVVAKESGPSRRSYPQRERDEEEEDEKEPRASHSWDDLAKKRRKR